LRAATFVFRPDLTQPLDNAPTLLGAFKIRGKRHWLWRAVDQHGIVLDILVQSRRDQHAAERFLRQVVDCVGYEPRVVITDKLASYLPAIRRVLPNAEHRRHKRLNNRAENSHLPPRKRERLLQRFTSADHAQRFLGPFIAVSNHFRPRVRSTPPHRFRLSSVLSGTACGEMSPWAECVH
jgi:putative transposase